MSQTSRTRLETFKFVLYLSFPLVFGYGLGRLPHFWEQAAEYVSAMSLLSKKYITTTNIAFAVPLCSYESEGPLSPERGGCR